MYVTTTLHVYQHYICHHYICVCHHYVYVNTMHVITMNVATIYRKSENFQCQNIFVGPPSDENLRHKN